MSERGDHHGNLREAPIEAVFEPIGRQGPQGFTLSDAAKAAGVTPAAVDRHFAGRDDLIAEIVWQGFEIFADLMEHASDNGGTTALAAFEATGRTYLAFARKFPGRYVAMFESGIVPNTNPDLAGAAERARQVFGRSAEALSQHLPADRRPPASMFSAHIWARSHGVVEFFARGAPGARAPFPPEDILETGIGTICAASA